MQKKKALSIRHRSLGAPFVVTAVLAAGCEPVHANPAPPTNPPAPTVTSNPPAPTEATPTNPPAPTTAPTTTSAPVATTAPSAPPPGTLPDAPNDSSGSLVKNADGTCKWVYKYEPVECPPGDSCNPGPPRKPLAVKCPSGPSPKK